MLEDESQLPPQQGPTRMQIFVANKLTTIFPLLHNRVVKEQKMACPSNTPYTILKDGIVLLEHEACQEQPLDLLGTFKNRNPAMGTPNLCGFYYRMTDFVASQLYHLKLSEEGKPRPNLRKIYSEQICSFWMSSAVRVIVFNVRLQIFLTIPLSSMLWLMRMKTGPCQSAPRFWTCTVTCSSAIRSKSMVLSHT